MWVNYMKERKKGRNFYHNNCRPIEAQYSWRNKSLKYILGVESIWMLDELTKVPWEHDRLLRLYIETHGIRARNFQSASFVRVRTFEANTGKCG